MRTRSLFAIVLATAFAAPMIAAADPPEHCGRGGHSTFATLTSPEDGKVQANTTPTGAVSVETGTDVPAVFVSTTGTIVAEFEHACLLSLTLTVTRDGESAPFHSTTFSTDCGHATGTDDVEIGLEAGSYTFELSGETCSGAPVVTDGHGGFVADPPLL